MTQQESVLRYLQSGKCITPMEALEEFGCFRLASVVHSLRAAGHDVQTRMVGNGKKQWAQYYLVGAYSYHPKYAHQMPDYLENIDKYEENK